MSMWCKCGDRRRSDGSCKTKECDKYRVSARGRHLKTKMESVIGSATPLAAARPAAFQERVAKMLSAQRKRRIASGAASPTVVAFNGAASSTAAALNRNMAAAVAAGNGAAASAITEMKKAGDEMVDAAEVAPTRNCHVMATAPLSASLALPAPIASTEQPRAQAAAALGPRKADLARCLWARLETVRRMTSEIDACFVIGGALR